MPMTVCIGFRKIVVLQHVIHNVINWIKPLKLNMVARLRLVKLGIASWLSSLLLVKAHVDGNAITSQ